MARHTKVLHAKTFKDNTESDGSDTLAKQLNDLVATKTVIALSVTMLGQNPIAVIIYDDAE